MLGTIIRGVATGSFTFLFRRATKHAAHRYETTQSFGFSHIPKDSFVRFGEQVFGRVTEDISLEHGSMPDDFQEKIDHFRTTNPEFLAQLRDKHIKEFYDIHSVYVEEKNGDAARFREVNGVSIVRANDNVLAEVLNSPTSIVIAGMIAGLMVTLGHNSTLTYQEVLSTPLIASTMASSASGLSSALTSLYIRRPIISWLASMASAVGTDATIRALLG